MYRKIHSVEYAYDVNESNDIVLLLTIWFSDGTKSTETILEPYGEKG